MQTITATNADPVILVSPELSCVPLPSSAPAPDAPTFVAPAAKPLECTVGMYRVVDFSIDGHPGRLYPVMNAYAVHRHNWDMPINAVRDVRWLAVVSKPGHRAFHERFEELRAYLAAHEHDPSLLFDVPEAIHPAGTIIGGYVVRPLVGPWRHADYLIGKVPISLDGLFEENRLVKGSPGVLDRTTSLHNDAPYRRFSFFGDNEFPNKFDYDILANVRSGPFSRR